MKTLKQFIEETENHIGGPATYRTLKSHGYHYSGDRTEHGAEYSSKNGEAYHIYGSKWRHHSGASGNTLDSLKKHLSEPRN